MIEVDSAPEDYLRFNNQGSITIDGLIFMGDSEGGWEPAASAQIRSIPPINRMQLHLYDEQRE